MTKEQVARINELARKKKTVGLTEDELKEQAELRAEDVRVEVDAAADKLGAKIRRAQADKIPFMLVVGKREAESGQVSVRSRGEGDKGAMDVAAFKELFRAALQE